MSHEINTSKVNIRTDLAIEEVKTKDYLEENTQNIVGGAST